MSNEYRTNGTNKSEKEDEESVELKTFEELIFVTDYYKYLT